MISGNQNIAWFSGSNKKIDEKLKSIVILFIDGKGNVLKNSLNETFWYFKTFLFSSIETKYSVKEIYFFHMIVPVL